MEHLRIEKGRQRSLERRPTTCVDAASDQRVGHGRLVAERPDDPDEVGVLEEDQTAVAVVIRERPERLRPEGDLRIEPERAFADRSVARSSVHRWMVAGSIGHRQ